MNQWRQSIKNAAAELGAVVEVDETRAVVGYDRERFEVEFLTSHKPGNMPDSCLVSLKASGRLPAEYVCEILETCEPGVTPRFTSDADEDYLRVLSVHGALPVETITVGTLRWLFFALVCTRDSLKDADESR